MFTGMDYKPLPDKLVLALANGFGKKIEEIDEVYTPIKTIGKDDYGDFKGDYKDAVKEAAEKMNKSAGVTTAGKKVLVPKPPKTAEQEKKDAEQTERADIKHDVPKPPPGPPLTKAQKKVFKEVMEPIRILLQHVV